MEGALIRQRVAQTPHVWHYGIAVGPDVIHFMPHSPDPHPKKKLFSSGAAAAGRRGTVHRGPRDAPGAAPWQVAAAPPSEHDAAAIAAFARQYVGAQFPYDVLTQNCEHFAQYCFCCRAWSAQSDKALVGLGSGFGGLLGTAGGSVAAAAAATTATAAAVAAAPPVTALGSTTLGSLCVSWGVLAAPAVAAPPAWPFVLLAGTVAVAGAAAGAVVGRRWLRAEPQFDRPADGAGAAAEDGGECVVCLDALACVRLVPCNHTNLCRACYEQLQQRPGSRCPQCRAVIAKAV